MKAKLILAFIVVFLINDYFNYLKNPKDYTNENKLNNSIESLMFQKNNLNSVSLKTFYSKR